MALKHDAQGFLVGDPIDIGVALKTWDAIQKDVQAIRKAVTGAAASMAAGTKRQSGREQAATVVALPAGRRGGNAGATTRRAQTPSGKSRHAAVVVRQESQAATKTVAVPAGRDDRGRFVAGNTSIDGGLHDRDARTGDSAIRGFTERVVSAVNGAGGMEEADPAVKAFNEVAQPMARGYEMLTGGSEDKKQTGFLRRIFSTLNVFRKEETAYSKAANKSLKALEEKPEANGGGDGGGLLGMMSGLLSKIPVIGPMLAGGAGMMGGAGRGLMGAGKGLLGAGKGVLRRIPLLGALIGGVGAASDIYSSETDDSLTRRQKDENAGKAVGGFAGSVGGMLAGAKLGAMAGAIGGPIGVAIGGVLGGAVGMFFGDQAGQIIGDTVGGWVSDLREADIPGKIVGAWEATTDFLKKGWDGALEKLSDAWKSIKDAGSQAAQWASEKANSANNFIKDKTGVDVKGAAIAAKEKAVEVGTKAVEGAKAGVEYLGNNTTVGKGIKATGEAVRYGTDVAVDVAKSAKARITGKASENRAALVSQMATSGITDPKEQAMFMAQMDHESGGFTKMEERFNYRSADRLMAVSGSARKLGKPAVEAAMAQGPEAVAEAMYGGRMGNTNPGDAYKFRGRGHIQLTGRDNYAAASKALGIDLESNPDLAADPEVAAKVATWYWKKNPRLGEAARRGDVKGVTQGINGGQNGYDHRNELFAQYSAESSKSSLTAGSTSPAIGATVATVAAKPVAIASPAAPVVASISAPPVSVAPTAPTIAEAPPVTVPMASADTKKAAAASPPAQEAGQDLKDRRIAHIVTGGLSA